MLNLGPRLAVAEQLNGKEVHCVGKLLVLKLLDVEVGGRDEAIDQDKSGFLGVVGIRHLVAGVDAAQVGDVDGSGVGHCVIFLVPLNMRVKNDDSL